MSGLSWKLKKRLGLLWEAGGAMPWLDAPKQHAQLVALGLVVEGHIGDERYAVLVGQTTERNEQGT